MYLVILGAFYYALCNTQLMHNAILGSIIVLCFEPWNGTINALCGFRNIVLSLWVPQFADKHFMRKNDTYFFIKSVKL